MLTDAGAEQGYEQAAVLLGGEGRLYPRRMVTVAVDEARVDTVVKLIISVNKTGKPGEGKRFVLPIKDAVRVKNGRVW